MVSASFTFVFNSLNSLQKVQTLTNCLGLKANESRKGSLGKDLSFVGFFFPSVKPSFSFPSHPIVARRWSNCCVCVKDGMGRLSITINLLLVISICC